MKYNFFYFFIFIIIISYTSNAQTHNVGISDDTGFIPNTSAILHLNSNNKGFLAPRLTTQQRNSIVYPARGLLVFDKTLNQFMFWDSLQWVPISASGNSWLTTGNSGLIENVNFIGSTDNAPIEFRTNNIIRGKITAEGQIIWGNCNYSLPNSGELVSLYSTSKNICPLAAYSNYNSPAIFAKIETNNTTQSAAISTEYAGTNPLGAAIRANAINDSSIALHAIAKQNIGTAALIQGDLLYTGSLLSPSDCNIKTNISPIPNTLEKILAINPVQYNYTQNEISNYNFDRSVKYGFIAQQLDTLFPSLVIKKNIPNTLMNNHINIRTINYIEFIPILTEAIKQQNNLIKNLEQQINLNQTKIIMLEEKIKNLETIITK